jgi:hypothetical protein
VALAGEKLESVAIVSLLPDCIVLHAFPQTALGKRGSPCRRTAATETRNFSRKDAKAAKVGKNGENHLREYFTFPSELGAFAPWREEFPNPRTLDFRNI